MTDQLDELTGRATFQVIDSAAIAGTAVAGPLPQEVSVVATLRTAGIGPSQRGRIYLPPVANDSVTAAGRLQTASQTTIVEAVAGMLNSLLDQGHVPVIYHPSNLAGDPVTSVDVGDVFDAQRRRRDKLIEVRISRTVE